MSLVVAYINANYNNTCHILWKSSKQEEIRLQHDILFVLILYLIGVISSKKCQSEGLKKVKKRETGRFAIERGFSKEGRIKPAHNAFTTK